MARRPGGWINDRRNKIAGGGNARAGATRNNHSQSSFTGVTHPTPSDLTYLNDEGGAAKYRPVFFLWAASGSRRPMLSLATAAALAAPASEGWYGAGAQFGAASSLTPSSHMRGMPPPLAMPTASDLPSASTQGWSGLKKDKEDVEPMSCGMLYYVHVPKTGGSTVFDRLQKVKHGWGYNRLYWGDDGPAEENK